MPVTQKKLQRVLQGLYSGDVLLKGSDTVVFGVRSDNNKHFAHVSLRLCRQFPTAPEPQAIEISLIFTDKGHREYTIDHLDPLVVGQFCMDRQMDTDWSELQVHMLEDGHSVFALFRKVFTSPDDIKMAKKRDFASSLYTGLFHTLTEFEYIAKDVVALAEIPTEEQKQLRLLEQLPSNVPKC